jgi:hypothetical protein
MVEEVGPAIYSVDVVGKPVDGGPKAGECGGQLGHRACDSGRGFL